LTLALGSHAVSVFVLKQMQQSKKNNGTNMVHTWIKCWTAFVQVGLGLPRYGLGHEGPGLGLGLDLGGPGIGLGLVTCGLVDIT